VVLYAAIQAHQDERRFESGRPAHARRAPRVCGKLLADIRYAGAAGRGAGRAARSLLGLRAGAHVFEFHLPRVERLIWLLGGGAGVLGVGLAGLLGAAFGVESAAGGGRCAEFVNMPRPVGTASGASKRSEVVQGVCRGSSEPWLFAITGWIVRLMRNGVRAHQIGFLAQCPQISRQLGELVS